MAVVTDHPYLLLISGVLFIYTLWVAIYRLFLHPLAHIPGPLLPRLTSWHECYYDFFLGGKHPWQLKAMHREYGPIIRPVPDEVHINDPEFLDSIYATRNRNQDFAGGLLVDESVGATEDYAHHRLRRDALNPYFSPKAVMNMEYLLMGKRDKLTAIFEDALKSKRVLNMSDVMFAFANDVVRAFSFGSDSGLLDDLPMAKIQRENLTRLLTGVALNKQFPWIQRGLAKVLPMLFGEKAIPPTVMDMIKFRAKVGTDIEAVFADKTNDYKNGHSIFYELRDTPILPPEEKTVKRLQDEATLLIMAGTESPAKSMSIATFYTLNQPEVMSKLRKEISNAQEKSATNELPLKTLMALPYIAAIIEEANRLSFGVTRRMVRYSPKETLAYTAPYGPCKATKYTLPPGTRMSTVTYCTHTNEELFPDPWTFDPERWLTEAESDGGSSVEEVNRRKRCMMALGKGHRVCLGRNVANAEQSLMLAVLAQYDMRLHDTDESDVQFKHDYQVSHPRLDTLGVRAVVEGKHCI